MPVRVGDSLRQVNDSTLYPVVQAAEVQVVDTAGNFAPPSIRSYKDLESVLAELAAGSSGSNTFTATFTDSSLQANDAVASIADDIVGPTDATDPDFPVIGFVSSLNNPSPGQCQVQSTGALSGFSGLVPTKRYIISTSQGTIVEEGDTSSIAPSEGSGQFVQVVGVAVSTTTLLIDIKNFIVLI